MVGGSRVVTASQRAGGISGAVAGLVASSSFWVRQTHACLGDQVSRRCLLLLDGGQGEGRVRL
jgi:hypothetical protein